MIKSFGDRETELLWTTGKVKKLDKQIIKRAFRKLEYIDLASNILDLKVPPSNKLEDLIGKLQDFHSIRVNDKYRIIFRFIGSDAFDVEITNHYK
ncbi:MAG: type II toxin-antitoxin system RelE/ParE family toxin [Opitutales bacterium]